MPYCYINYTEIDISYLKKSSLSKIKPDEFFTIVLNKLTKSKNKLVGTRG